MPHGVLFRGGDEKEIRKGIIEADRLEAVIGLAPNLFYGTGIPACILVLRGTGPRPAERRGKVLFINADREFTAGRAQNYLRPAARREDRHCLPRVRATSPASPASWTSANCADNDFNLNIRRYVDNTPPPEPQDVRAHLHGGVPRRRSPPMRRRSPLTASTCGPLRPTERVPGYRDFPTTGWRSVADEIPALASPKEAELHEAFDDWWDSHVKHIIELPGTGRPGHGDPPRPARLVRRRAGAARRRSTATSWPA